MIDFNNCRATHGTREMSKEELSKYYGEENIWHEISLLKENPSQHCNNNNIIIMDMFSIVCSFSNDRKAEDNY